MSIEILAFYNCSDDLTIYVKAGSYAETWAKEQGYNTAYIASAPLPDKTDTGNQNTGSQDVNNQNQTNQNNSRQNSDNKDTVAKKEVTIPKVAKVTKFKATAKKKGFTLS